MNGRSVLQFTANAFFNSSSNLRILNNLVDSNDDSSLTTTTETWNISDARRDSVLGQFTTNSVISKLAEFVFL